MRLLGPMLCSSIGCLLLASGTSRATANDVSASEVEACRSLGNGAKVGNLTALSAQFVADGRFQPLSGKAIAGLPPFCRVVAMAAPSPQSHIVIEVWLPTQSNWNGKFLGTGNGGFGGEIITASLAGGLRRGFATANTDMGTHPAGSVGVGYAAGNGQPQTVRDWGFRATHEMALFGKEIVLRLYKAAAKKNYFVGCSTGGHQALTEAQRYPEDFDAIIAGAPGLNRTHLHAMFTNWSIQLRRPGSEAPTLTTTGLWRKAQLAACLTRQGGAPDDSFLPNPATCSLKPAALLCRPGQDTTTCLSPAQINALDVYLTGTRNPRTGALIYPPLTYAMVGGGRAAATPGGPPVAAELSRWVFGPQWDAASFDFDGDMARVDQALAGVINANNPDLSRFAARGGKLLMFHGWDDPIVSPFDSILYFDRAFAVGAHKSDFLRLFMVPGMSHCAGGAGPTMFGQEPAFPVGSAEEDLIAALDRWAETGIAPEVLRAKRLSGGLQEPFEGRKLLAERPICAYPWVARYKGSGSTTDPASFVCHKALPVAYAAPALLIATES